MVRACALEVLEAHRSISFFPFLPALIPEHAPFFFFFYESAPPPPFFSPSDRKNEARIISRVPPPPACPITLPRRPTFLLPPSI